MKHARRVFVGSVAMVAAAALAVPTSASASSSRSPELITSGLIGPLHIDVGHRGQVYVAQSFAGTLTKVRTNGSTVDLLSEPGSINGVESRRYSVFYLFTGGTEEEPVAELKARRFDGSVRTIADLQAFEEANNPDAGNIYGFAGLSEECAEQVPAEIGGEPYSGIIESNPYSLANAPGGGWYVADAAANSVLHVTRRGHVSVVSVLDPRPVTVTAEIADAVGLPECTIGADYSFEPVPTDVEVAPNGRLVVSLLPGGPEDDSLGARGTVVRINPANGAVTELAEGFLGATNVAVAGGGRVFVTEIFGNKISKLQGGQITPVLDVGSPAAIEFARGKLYTTTDVFTDGNLWKLRP